MLGVTCEIFKFIRNGCLCFLTVCNKNSINYHLSKRWMQLLVFFSNFQINMFHFWTSLTHDVKILLQKADICLFVTKWKSKWETEGNGKEEVKETVKFWIRIFINVVNSDKSGEWVEETYMDFLAHFDGKLIPLYLLIYHAFTFISWHVLRKQWHLQKVQLKLPCSA